MVSFYEMRNTVLVLGAGSSIPYGFPSGTKLMQNIANRARQLSVTKINAGEHANLCLQMSDKLFDSSFQSIDAFLSQNPKFLLIGKALIALEILRHEDHKKAQLFEDYNDEAGNMIYRGEDWIRNVLGRVPTEHLESIRIITFNYDRVLEHKLHRMWQVDGYSDHEINQRNQKLKILHVYGRLPLLREEAKLIEKPFNEDSIGFADFKSFQHANQISYLISNQEQYLGSIKILGEDDSNAKTAKEFLTWAEKIIFLGWGFLNENVELLGLKNRSNLHHNVFATVHGMSKVKQSQILRDLSILRPEKIWDVTCAKLFEDHHDILT